MIDAVVIGSGPNGLTAAVMLARAGAQVQVLEAQPTVGGGARTADLGLAPGVIHDLCSAVHPLGWASPAFRALDLAGLGVDLIRPEIAYAHPLPDGSAALAHHDLAETVAGLGADGPGWRRLFGPLVDRVDALVATALGDMRHLPSDVHLRALPGLAGFALTTLAGARLGPRAGALLAGVSTHANTRVPAPAATATGLLLATLGHTGRSWAIPRGGSQAITDALVAELRRLGGAIHTDSPVTSTRDLPPARVYLADVAPAGAASIFADRIAPRVASRLRHFRHGAGVAKVDLVLDGPVPWRVPEVGRAATVHLGGSRTQIRRAEDEVARGRHASDPVVLVSDPSVLDPDREVDGLRPLWTYAHVPSGSDRDLTATVLDRIEREAPGFRDRVVAARCVPASRMSEHNANYRGGDVLGGAVSLPRVIGGPTMGPNPYRIADSVYLCSSSTPPGPGVHGLSGAHAAQHALRELGLPESSAAALMEP